MLIPQGRGNPPPEETVEDRELVEEQIEQRYRENLQEVVHDADYADQTRQGARSLLALNE